MRFRWQFDPVNQRLNSPFGWSVTVREIATWLQDRLHNRHDLTGPWAGWRVRGRYLKGPRGQVWTPEALAHKAPPEN